MTVYTPDSWVILRMTHKNQVTYKVLGGWSESYLYGSSWRLNGGIEKAEYDISNEQWRFYGSSGSVYIVNHESYGLRPSTLDIYEKMFQAHPDKVSVLEQRDWTTMDWSK